MTLPPQAPGPRGPLPFQPSPQQQPAPSFLPQHPQGPRQHVPGRPVPHPPGLGARPPQPSAGQPSAQPSAQPTGSPSAPAVAPAVPIAPTAQPDIEPRLPQHRAFDLPVSTTASLPGREVATVLGVVFGVVTRPRDLAHNPEMAFIHTTARQDAVAAMVSQAQALGAHAVVGLAFDGGKVSDGVSEVTAYGTAVTLA